MTFVYVLILITLFIAVPIGSFVLVRHMDRKERAAEAEAAAAPAEAPLSLDKAA